MRTSNIERVRIDASGNVGIGTNSPLNLQHLHKASANAFYSQFTNTTTGNSNATDGFRIGIDANGNAILFNERADTFNGNMNFYTDSTQRMTIYGLTGFVGIGTAVPYNLQHLHRDSTNSLYTQYTNTTTGSTSGSAGFRIGIDGNGNAILNSNYSTGSMRFSTAGSERMRIASNGNVGIATSVPQWKLEVFDSTNASSPDTVISGSDTTITTYMAAASFTAANPDVNTNIGAIAYAKNGTDTNYGMQGVSIEISAVDTLTNVGVHGLASGALQSNWGLFGSANYHIDTLCRLVNAGVHSNASGSPWENRAGSFTTSDTARLQTGATHKNFHYSVWARSTAGEPGPNTPWGTAPYYSAGHFLGDVYVLGSIINQPTDHMDIDTSKTKSLPGDSALIWLNQLSPKSLYVKSGLENFPKGWHFGFDNNSVRQHLPALTRDIFRPKGYAHICDSTLELVRDTSIVHNEIIPLLVAGVNQLSTSQNIWNQTTTNVSLADSSKNVGIGISTPTECLEVNGNIKAHGKIFVTDDDTVYDLLAMITQLQNDVALLKEQLQVMVKN